MINNTLHKHHQDNFFLKRRKNFLLLVLNEAIVFMGVDRVKIVSPQNSTAHTHTVYDSSSTNITEFERTSKLKSGVFFHFFQFSKNINFFFLSVAPVKASLVNATPCLRKSLLPKQLNGYRHFETARWSHAYVYWKRTI